MSGPGQEITWAFYQWWDAYFPGRSFSGAADEDDLKAAFAAGYEQGASG